MDGPGLPNPCPPSQIDDSLRVDVMATRGEWTPLDMTKKPSFIRCFRFVRVSQQGGGVLDVDMATRVEWAPWGESDAGRVDALGA